MWGDFYLQTYLSVYLQDEDTTSIHNKFKRMLPAQPTPIEINISPRIDISN